ASARGCGARRAREEGVRDLRVASDAELLDGIRTALRGGSSRLHFGRFDPVLGARLVRRDPEDAGARGAETRARALALGNAGAARDLARERGARGRGRVPHGRSEPAPGTAADDGGWRRSGPRLRPVRERLGRRRTAIRDVVRRRAGGRLLAVRAARALRGAAGPRAVLPRDDLARSYGFPDARGAAGRHSAVPTQAARSGPAAPRADRCLLAPALRAHRRRRDGVRGRARLHAARRARSLARRLV